MRNNNEISRSKIELFIKCPRCFWLEVKHNIKRPEEIKGTFIGSKYDPILKKELDEHRKQKKTPEEIEKRGFFLFPDTRKLVLWRKRLEFFHKDHNLVYWGKIDDLLINKEKLLIPFDFKTTLSKNFSIYEDYKRQLEIYGYLLKKQGEGVESKGVLYVIKIDINEKYEKTEEREVYILDNLNYDAYDEVLENLKEVYYSKKEPDPSPNCSYCERDFKILNLKYNQT